MEQAKLDVNEQGNHRTVWIEKERFTMGRREDNDLRLGGADVSRLHAEIVRVQDRYRVRDLGSRFGTFVNDEQVNERELHHGDRLRLGGSGQNDITFMMDGPRGAEHTTRQTQPAAAIVGDLRQVTALLEGLRAMGSGRVLEDVLAIVVDLAIEVSGAERGFVMLADEKNDLEHTLARRRGGPLSAENIVATSQQIPGKVFRTGELEVVPDLLEPTVAAVHGRTAEFGIRAALCVPLRLARFGREAESPASASEAGNGGPQKPRTIGVLYLDSRQKGALLSPGTTVALEALADEAAVAIENARLYRESLEKERLVQELKFAAEMQQRLLPPGRRSTGPFEVSGVTVPCRAIGGDFFDYFDISDGRLGVTLADVSGKGPSAALLAAKTQGIFFSLAELGEGPSRIIEQVNRALVRRQVESKFVTLAYAVLSPDGKVVCCNAGHNPPLVLRADSRVQALDEGGPPLGIFEVARYAEEDTVLAPGDTLVLFSDGVTEAANSDADQFGDERVLECLQGGAELSANALLERLLRAVSDFCGSTPQADDITVLVVKYVGG